jgi:hypothetical protein
MHGDPGRVRIASPRPRGFVDGLWRTTCFEAFVAAGEGYDEFNLSPSGEFAAYRFSAYRAGMARLDTELSVVWSSGRLEATVPLREDARRLALSAVVEESDGALSYWALRHAPGKPDFHHRDTFALSIDEIRN